MPQMLSALAPMRHAAIRVKGCLSAMLTPYPVLTAASEQQTCWSEDFPSGWGDLNSRPLDPQSLGDRPDW